MRPSALSFKYSTSCRGGGQERASGGPPPSPRTPGVPCTGAQWGGSHLPQRVELGALGDAELAGLVLADQVVVHGFPVDEGQRIGALLLPGPQPGGTEGGRGVTPQSPGSPLHGVSGPRTPPYGRHTPEPLGEAAEAGQDKAGTPWASTPPCRDGEGNGWVYRETHGGAVQGQACGHSRGTLTTHSGHSASHDWMLAHGVGTRHPASGEVR